MKKHALGILSLLFVVQIHAFENSGVFDNLHSSQEWQAIRTQSKDSVSNLLSQFTLNVTELYAASRSMSGSLKKVTEKVAELERQVQRPNGPVSGIISIVRLVEELEGMIRRFSEKEDGIRTLPSIASTYWNLVGHIDNLKINDLLIPVNTIFFYLRDILQRTLRIRSAVGSFATTFISDELAQTINKIIHFIDSMIPKMNDIIVEGKIKLGGFRQFSLFRQLYTHRKTVPALIAALESMKVSIPPLMNSFLTQLNVITQAVNPVVVTAQNFKSTLKRGLDERRKETKTGIVGPRIMYQEVVSILTRLHSSLNTVLDNMGGTVSDLSQIIKIVVATIVEKTKEYINFDVLKPRAYEAAITIPPYVDQVVKDVYFLQSLIPRSRVKQEELR